MIQIMLMELGTQVQRKKGDVILSQGQVGNTIFFVKSGLIKAFYTTKDGNEFIKSFLQDGEIITSLSCYALAEPSPFSLICLEDSELLQIPFEAFKNLANNDTDFARGVITMLTNLLMKKEQREYEFLCLSAEERFELLFSTAPHLLNRIKQQDIARYLGITPVALSRIRSKMTNIPKLRLNKRELNF
jgi:CRP-like cAMP-binding protein